MCTKIEEKANDGGVNVKCICKTLSPTTIDIVDEFTNIFKDNKNLQKILSLEGSELIAEMEWWNYAIFYIGSLSTSVWLGLISYGYHLDKIDINKKKEAKKKNNLNISKD